MALVWLRFGLSVFNAFGRQSEGHSMFWFGDYEEYQKCNSVWPKGGVFREIGHHLPGVHITETMPACD